MPGLADRQCVPCKGGVPPLTVQEIALLAQLEGWQVAGDHHVEQTYRLTNFVQALELVNRTGVIAGAQNHHPDIALADFNFPSL